MDNKKRGVIGIIFSLVILLSIVVSADDCSVVLESACSDTIVMKLSGLTNAHGELFDGIYYSYVLCCDFTGIQSCDGTNKILGLSADTNAHAQIPSQTTYTSPVCFADIECASNSGSCASGYDIEMLSLSASTNAHLGEFSDVNNPIKICCKQSCTPDPISVTCLGRECGDRTDNCNQNINCGTCTQGECNANGRCVSEDAYWANANDLGYINNLEVIPGFTKVALVVKTTSFIANSTINFEIYEDDLDIPFISSDDEIRTGENALSGIIDESGVGVTYWTITQNDLSKTSDLGEFYFLSDIYESNDLSLSVSTGTCIGINYCSNYGEELICNADTCAVAEASVKRINDSITCGEDYLCGCSWNLNENKCTTKWEPINQSSIFNPGNNFALGVGTCNYNENTNDDCTDGYLNSSWVANIIWPADNLGWNDQPGCTSAGGDDDTCILFDPLVEPIEPNFDGLWHYDPLINGENSLFNKCRGGSSVSICPAQIQLAFFTLKNFIIAIVILAAIYIWYAFREKKKSKTKKHKKRTRNSTQIIL